MRTAFIPGSRKAAVSACPWAAIIVKVDGGYLAFESIVDHRRWKRQK